MGCNCYFCNTKQRAKPEPRPPCRLTPKEKVLRQQKQRIVEHVEYLERERQIREAERPAREAKEKAIRDYRVREQDKYIQLREAQEGRSIVPETTQVSTGVKMNPNNMHWPAEDFTKRERYDIQWDFSKQDTVSLALLTLEEAEEYLENLQKNSAYDNMSEGKNYTGLAMGLNSAYSLGKTLNSFGASARAVVINGVDHIVIENYKPKYLDLGTRWQRSTPQMLKMGLGLNTFYGNAHFFKANIIVEIAFSGAVNAADYMMNDEVTLREVVKRFSADVAKGVATGVIAQSFVVGGTYALSTVGFMVPVVGQVAFFAVACFIIGYKISELDNQYKYTDDMLNKIEGLINEI